MSKRFSPIALAALTLTGCSTSLPSMQTEGRWAGRCFTINYIPILDMGAYLAADIMDGWKCYGIRDGELPRGGTKEEFLAEQRGKIADAQDARRMKKAPKIPKIDDDDK